MADAFLDLVPDACTLPAAEQPSRMAEFGALLAGSSRAQTRLSATRLQWVLDPAAATAARDLAARESSCCSFFTFSFDVRSAYDGDALVVDVDVPETQVPVLDALQQLASRSLGDRVVDRSADGAATGSPTDPATDPATEATDG